MSGGGMGDAGIAGMSSMTGSMNGMGGMGHMGAFGMSGVTAGGIGGVGPTSGMGRMSGLDGMGSTGGYGYGYGRMAGYGYMGSGYGGDYLDYYGWGNRVGGGGGYGLGYRGAGLVNGGSFLGYSYPAYVSSLSGSAPGNYYYPYSNPSSLNSGSGFGYASAYVAPTASAPPEGLINPAAYQGRYLGIDEEPIVEAGGRKGMKVARVYPGTAADRAGLKAGDVIHSINGFLTERHGNLAWIIANAAYNNVLKIDVNTVNDGSDHTITVQLPESR